MSPMSSTARPLTVRRAAAVILATLSLAGISACSVSIGGGATDQGAAATASQAHPSSEQPAAASQSAESANSSQTPPSQATAPSTQEQSAPAASAEGSATGAASQPSAGSAGGRPGAQATITDSKWLEGLEDVDRTVSATPSMLLNQINDHVRIEGDVENLTVSADNVTVFVDHVGLLTITGTNVEVYVKDVDHVVIKGTNADVVWAGNTPKVDDFGSNTETRQQGTTSS